MLNPMCVNEVHSLVLNMSGALSALTQRWQEFYVGGVSKISMDTAQVNLNEKFLNQLPAQSMVVGELVVMLRNKALQASQEGAEQHAWESDELLVARLKGFESREKYIQEFRMNSDQAENVQTIAHFDMLGRFKMTAMNERPHYSNDLGNVFGSNSWHVFLPSPDILNFIVNGTLGDGLKVNLGMLRRAESDTAESQKCPMMIHVPDIRGKRSAMFGKTRLGKSNVVKLVMESMLAMTVKDQNVGQLVFDVNGEYANDNPQDGNTSIASLYSDRCLVYYLAHRPIDANMGKNRQYIRYNFFERTADCTRIISSLLDESDMAVSENLTYFLQLEFPDFVNFVKHEVVSSRSQRILRKIHLLWTALVQAGFAFSESHLLKLTQGNWRRVDLFSTNFSNSLRMAMYQAIEGRMVPQMPSSMEELVKEMLVYCKFAKQYPNDPNLMEGGVSMFDKDDTTAIRFIVPDSVSGGPKLLSSCIPYHAADATDFEKDIIEALDQGKTVIMDLGSANEMVLRFFSRTLSLAGFRHQEGKFVSNQLKNHFVQLYFEEAHMIFPPSTTGKVTDIYSRFAKEGAKFHIGIVYSTQSPSTVNSELLSQTENFFIGHLSNASEVALLANVQHAFENMGPNILRYRQPGFMHVLTHSHRYVVPVQARMFNGKTEADTLFINVD